MNVRGCRLAQLVVFQIFLLSVKGERRLIGPTETVWGLVGHEVILPCGLESEEDITGQGVEWARSDLTPKYVLIYQGYKTNNDHLHPSFKGRTSMTLDRLKKGNMSLTITDLRLNDSGTYECILPSVKTMLSAEVRLEIGLVSEPQILHPVSLVEKLTLTCEAKDWNPKPEVEWRDSEGQTVFCDPNGTKENENGYYDIHSTMIGDIKLSEYYVCIIRQKETDHTSKTTYIVPADVVTLKDSYYLVYFFMVTGWVALVILCGVMTCGYCTGRLSLKLQPDADGKVARSKDNAQEQIGNLKQQNEKLTKENGCLKEEIERSKTKKHLQSSPSFSSIDSKDDLLSQDGGSSTFPNQEGEDKRERKPQKDKDLCASLPAKDAT